VQNNVFFLLQQNAGTYSENIRMNGYSRLKKPEDISNFLPGAMFDDTISVIKKCADLDLIIFVCLLTYSC